MPCRNQFVMSALAKLLAKLLQERIQKSGFIIQNSLSIGRSGRRLRCSRPLR